MWSIRDYRPHHPEKGFTFRYMAEVTVKRWPWSEPEQHIIYRYADTGWRWEHNNKSCPVEVDWMEVASRH